MSEKKILLETKSLTKEFLMEKTFGKKQYVHAVTDVNLSILEGETVALVGESGCGKSTLGRMILKVIEPTRGQILFQGEDITQYNYRKMETIRPQMQMVFQDPYACLNPRKNVFQIISEPLITHHRYQSKEQLKREVIALLKQAGLSEEVISLYPHQFSGGQRQRIGIARAIALHPKLIICDEPVSALDVSVQSQILNLLKQLQKEYGLTYLFSSHDLSVVKFIADRVCVMYLGRICEIAETNELYEHPKHPYTQFLLDSIPNSNPRKRKERVEETVIELPSPVNLPKGCSFSSRCPYADEVCQTKVPELEKSEKRYIACHHQMK